MARFVFGVIVCTAVVVVDDVVVVGVVAGVVGFAAAVCNDRAVSLDFILRFDADGDVIASSIAS